MGAIKRKPLSVVVPVRYRSPYIGDLLHSCKENTVNVDDVEVLVGYDDRDLEMGKYLKKFSGLVTGYPINMAAKIFGVGEYTNYLVEKSVGKLVWWLAEDCLVKTKGYDQILKPLAKLYGDMVYKFAPMPDDGGGNAFPILTRKWLDTLGYWSPHSRIDSYVNTVGEQLPEGRGENPVYGLYMENVVITKKKSPLINPPSEIELRGVFYALRFEDERVKERIRQDVEKLRKEIQNEFGNK